MSAQPSTMPDRLTLRLAGELLTRGELELWERLQAGETIDAIAAATGRKYRTVKLRVRAIRARLEPFLCWACGNAAPAGICVREHSPEQYRLAPGHGIAAVLIRGKPTRSGFTFQAVTRSPEWLLRIIGPDGEMVGFTWRADDALGRWVGRAGEVDDRRHWTCYGDEPHEVAMMLSPAVAR